MKTIYIFLSFFIGCAWASEDHREHDAHVHGHAEMTLALSGKELELELNSPAMNLVGFEYQPQSNEDRKKVKDAVTFLSRPVNWIELDPAADCSAEKAHTQSPLIAKESHATDTHEHEHEHEANHEQHSDFLINVHYRCSNPDKITSVNLKGLFQQFPALQEIDTQWLTERRQSASELDAKHPVIRLQ